MSPESITIQLDDKRRQLGALWQKVQHVIGGVPLLMAGIDRFQGATGSGRALAVAEIVVAATLLAMFVRDVRRMARARFGKMVTPSAHAHAGPDWFDVVAGLLLILEAVLTTHPGAKPLYERALFYLGAATLFTGLAHGLLSGLSWKRRFVRIDSAGIRARLSPFRKFNLPWGDIVDIRLGERSVILLTKGDSHVIPLSHYGNAIEIRTALADWRERKAHVLKG
jgi:hypothetical protein